MTGFPAVTAALASAVGSMLPDLRSDSIASATPTGIFPARSCTRASATSNSSSASTHSRAENASVRSGVEKIGANRLESDIEERGLAFALQTHVEAQPRAV